MCDSSRDASDIPPVMLGKKALRLSGREKVNLK